MVRSLARVSVLVNALGSSFGTDAAASAAASWPDECPLDIPDHMHDIPIMIVITVLKRLKS